MIGCWCRSDSESDEDPDKLVISTSPVKEQARRRRFLLQDSDDSEDENVKMDTEPPLATAASPSSSSQVSQTPDFARHPATPASAGRKRQFRAAFDSSDDEESTEGGHPSMPGSESQSQPAETGRQDYTEGESATPNYCQPPDSPADSGSVRDSPAPKRVYQSRDSLGGESHTPDFNKIDDEESIERKPATKRRLKALESSDEDDWIYSLFIKLRTFRWFLYICFM